MSLETFGLLKKVIDLCGVMSKISFGIKSGTEKSVAGMDKNIDALRNAFAQLQDKAKSQKVIVYVIHSQNTMRLL